MSTAVERRPTPRQIIQRICAEAGFAPEDVLSASRVAGLAETRMRIMRELVNGHGWSFNRTGIYMNRDHTTVIHACRQKDRPITPVKNPKLARELRDRFQAWCGEPVKAAPVEPALVEPVPPVIVVSSPLRILIASVERNEDLDAEQRASRISAIRATFSLLRDIGPGGFASFGRGRPSRMRHPPFVEARAPS